MVTLAHVCSFGLRPAFPPSYASYLSYFVSERWPETCRFPAVLSCFPAFSWLLTLFWGCFGAVLRLEPLTFNPSVLGSNPRGPTKLLAIPPWTPKAQGIRAGLPRMGSGQRPAFHPRDWRLLHVPISQARMAAWNCDDCGETTSRLTWLAVDSVQRPDLTARLSDLIEVECPHCRGALRRTHPLLVLRLAKVAPLIAARASGDELDPMESLGKIIAVVQQELGDAVRDVPGPHVVATFDEIEAVVRDDLDADVDALMVGGSEAAGHESAYVRLLRKIATTQGRQRIEKALEELALVGSEQQLREVVQQRLEITTDEAEQRARQHLEQAPTDDRRRFAESMLRTVQLVRRGDLRGAWSVRESVIRRFWEETVVPRQRAFEDAERGASPEALARAGLDLLEVLLPGTYPELRAEVAATTVAALLQGEGADRDQNIERAIELAQTVISILDQHPDIDHPQRRVSTLMNLSAAYGMRPRGDPAWNRTQSLTLLTDAIERAWQSGARDSWAMAQTNLGLLLLNRGEAGDVEQAREHLELALSHKSRKRDPGDWAFTQLHLGRAYARADSGDRGANLRRGIRHSANARDGARSASQAPLLAYAEHNLAAQQYKLSQVAGIAPAHQFELLDRAEASAMESVRLSPVGASPLLFGHAWFIIGEIRSARADQDGAIEALKVALTALSADMLPAEAREASRRLIVLADERDDVDLAADAAQQLIEAAAAAISTHSRADDRISEHSKSTTDFRFAAHALVRAGRLENAVTALELGRTRELGLLTLAESIDLDALSHLDPGLRVELENAIASFRADILGLEDRSASDRSEQFARIRSALRQIPTFEKALDTPTLDEISEAARPQRPLVYLGSAPKGSFAIIVDRGKDGGVALEAIHAPDCNSQAIVHLAMFGLKPDGIQVASAAYLAAQAHAPELLDAAIEALSPLIGEGLLRPLAASLAGRGASGVTLVPAGLLGLMPLHGIAWSDATGNQRSLIDDFDVTFAPSARLQLSCMQRASRRDSDPVRFVGIANPLPHSTPLEGAELEIGLVEGLMPTGDSLVLKGEEATKERVLEVLPSATHAHFACHGGGGFLDPLLSAALSLSGEEELSALEVAGLEIPARLVVASACETGVVQDYYAVDEALGLATAFVAAGAAGVISTLWEVDDFATALIVSKFYEGLFLAKRAPAAALREAQLWLRDADEADIDAYESTRAPLRALRRGRRRTARHPCGRRLSSVEPDAIGGPPALVDSGSKSASG